MSSSYNQHYSVLPFFQSTLGAIFLQHFQLTLLWVSRGVCRTWVCRTSCETLAFLFLSLLETCCLLTLFQSTHKAHNGDKFSTESEIWGRLEEGKKLWYPLEGSHKKLKYENLSLNRLHYDYFLLNGSLERNLKCVMVSELLYN